MEKIKTFFKSNKKETLVFILFFLVASVSVLYSLTLPPTVHNDTYVTLLANRVSSDPTYPDRASLLHLDYKPYLYTNVLSYLSNNFSLYTGNLILLFIAVFSTLYFTYLAFRLLGFSLSISTLVSLVSLVPRGEIAGGMFGVFTADDVLGGVFAVPVMWMIMAWLIKRRFDKKSLWPVMFVSGLFTYIHPVSMIFFNCVLFVTIIYWTILEKNYKEDIKNFLYSLVAFFLSASLLLFKIFNVFKGASLSKVGFGVATANEYAQALLYRTAFDFFPTSAGYALQFFLVNIFFLVAVVYIYSNIRKGRIVKGDKLYFISQFGFFIMILSVFLSFFLPALQLWLIQKFDFPYILEQASRFFRYYYLGLFLLWGVAVTILLEQYREKRKILFTLLLIVGICSSTFVFELFQFAVGYYGYQKEYIPNFLQADKLTDMTKIYPTYCDQIKKAGITREDLIISDDFKLRYWCQSRLFITFEEGSIYLLSGKNELVWWEKNYKEQEQVLHEGSAKELTVFAKRLKARYALLEVTSPMVKEFGLKGEIVSLGDHFAVIQFK